MKIRIPELFADWRLYIRAPTGEVFEISKDATFQGGRIKSSNKVISFICYFMKLNINILKQIFPSQGCEIEISNLNRKDEGEWRWPYSCIFFCRKFFQLVTGVNWNCNITRSHWSLGRKWRSMRGQEWKVNRKQCRLTYMWSYSY